MRPILLLAPPGQGSPPRESGRIEVRRGADRRVDAARYGAVIVVNSGGAGTLGCLRQALGLCRRSGDLDVGVLTYLDPAALAALCGGPAPRATGDPGRLGSLGPELRVELSENGLTLEYQVP